jgi:hypothetical protein
MKRPKLEDTRITSGHQSIEGRSVSVYAYSKMQDEYIDHLESKAENLPISPVRLSCYQEVWQKWVDTHTEDEFDKWLHDKMHEA